MIIITMQNGKQIKIKLDHKAAPITCANFEKLAKEVILLEHTSDDTAQFLQLFKYNSVVAGLHEYYCIAT